MTRILETSPRPAAPRLKGQEAPWVGPLKPGLRRPRRAATAWAISDSRCRIPVRLDPGATWLLGAPQCRASWSSGPRCGPLVSLRVVSGSGRAAGQGSPMQRDRVLPELLHLAAVQQKPHFSAAETRVRGLGLQWYPRGWWGAARGVPSCRPLDHRP